MKMERNLRKTRVGKVVSDKMDKTIVVAIEDNIKHPKYGKIVTLDTGHFHLTESIADKVSSLLLFTPEIMLHVSRPIRWDSDHVVIMNDDIASVPRAIAIARRTKKVMLQAVLVGLGLAIIGMVAAAFNLIPVVIGAFMQEAIDVVSILWALTALLDRE